jgi:streptogramin lyase
MTLRTISFTTLAAAAILSAPASLHAQGKAATPCALLSDAQIKAVLGTPTLAGKLGESECTWADAKGETRVYLSVKESGIEYKSFHDSMKATGKMVPVTGLAEDAFYVASSGASAALYALKSKHLYLVTVDGVGFSKADNEAAEKALLIQALAKH